MLFKKFCFLAVRCRKNRNGSGSSCRLARRTESNLVAFCSDYLENCADFDLWLARWTSDEIAEQTTPDKVQHSGKIRTMVAQAAQSKPRRLAPNLQGAVEEGMFTFLLGVVAVVVAIFIVLWLIDQA